MEHCFNIIAINNVDISVSPYILQKSIKLYFTNTKLQVIYQAKLITWSFWVIYLIKKNGSECIALFEMAIYWIKNHSISIPRQKSHPLFAVSLFKDIQTSSAETIKLLTQNVRAVLVI